MIFCGYEALPWTIRMIEWGRKACIIGTQNEILAAVVPQTAAGEALETLQSLYIFGLTNAKAGHSVRSVFLHNPAYIYHPGIMFGRWCPDVWDGTPVEAAPPFYHGIDDYTETVLLQMGDETQAIGKRIAESSQASDLVDVPETKQFMMTAFASSITDPSTLKSCFQSNRAYHDIKHDCLEADGGVVPDFQHRYLSEDVPIGLAFVKGLAQILEIPTPTTDKVLVWAQEQLGLELMVDGKLAGRDLQKTCAPQAVGITTQSDLFKATMTASESEKTSALQLPGKTSRGLVKANDSTNSGFYGWAIVAMCALCAIFKDAGGSMMFSLDGPKFEQILTSQSWDSVLSLCCPHSSLVQSN
jgi:hypothetical protein